jgi:hypothetical protein
MTGIKKPRRDPRTTQTSFVPGEVLAIVPSGCPSVSDAVPPISW